MSKLGALGKIFKAFEAMLEGSPPKGDVRRGMKSYLRDADPRFRDSYPGRDFEPYVLGDVPKEVYRGGSPKLRLKEEGPIFSTPDPRAASWYSGEFSSVPRVGALGRYKTESQNPARLRDLYSTMLDVSDEPVLLNEYSNPWDWLYSPEVRSALKDRGHDSAYGWDILDRGEIPTFIGLSKDNFKPVERLMMYFGDNPKVKSLPWDVDPDLSVIGRSTKWRKGGLINGR